MPQVKESWIDRAINTYNYHCQKLKEYENLNRNWLIEDTADALNRSLGSVSEDILIANWLKTHEDKIRSFKYAKDAIAFIREKKKKMFTEIE